MFRSGGLFWVLSFLLTMASAPSVQAASGCSLRAPQVALNSTALQSYLTANDGGINVLTDQLDDQYFAVPIANASPLIFVKLALNSTTSSFGLYGAPSPSGAATRCELFPKGTPAGWFASCRFSGTTLTVTLFDALAFVQGVSKYGGFNNYVVGWYMQDASGIFYSQDARNGGPPQVLTYAGTGPYTGCFWECVEGAPYGLGTSTFVGAVLEVQAYGPILGPPGIDLCSTPVRTSTWGSLKAIYR